MLPVLVIVIPCYNEQEVLPVTSGMFLETLESLIKKNKINENSRILFVDDGSSDDTWNIISELSEQSDHFCGLKQSRNRGHQVALLSGLMEVCGNADIAVSIDCDGQDDIAAIELMVDENAKGADVVYGVRSKRETDTFFKRFTAEAYYKLLNRMGAEVVFNHADYRLLSAKALNALSEYSESNLYLRGMIPLIGFKSSIVYYERNERIAGSSHYPLGKMLKLAFDGITSLTIQPLRFIIGWGIFVSLISFIGVIWALIGQFMGNTVAGWTSMTCIICFIGGCQMIFLGVIGEYVGKTYMEVKKRPRWFVEEKTNTLESFELRFKEGK